MTEPQLARAALASISAFEQLQPISTRLASALMFGVAVSSCFDQGYTESDLVEMVYRITRDRETVNLNGHDPAP